MIINDPLWAHICTCSVARPDEVDKRTSAEKPDEETGEKTPNRRRFKSVAPPPRAVLGGRFGWEKGYADWEKAEKADGEGAEGE